MASASPSPTLPSYQPLVVVLAATSAGIIADRYFAIPTLVWSLSGIVALSGWLWRRRNGRHTTAAICLLIAAATASGAWHHQWWYVFAADDLGHAATLEPQPIAIEGVAQSGPRRMPAPPHNPLRAIEVGDRTRLDLQVTSVRDGDTWRSASGNTTLVINGHLFDVFAGDRVRVFGQLIAPSPAQNPGEFDYAEFCRGNRVLCLVRCDSPQCVEVVARAGWWQPQRWIDSLRTAGESTLWRFISPKNAGLAAAMFLGLREELDPVQMDAFKETGTVHLLVISGLNVGILAACVLLALRTGWLSNRAALVLLAATTVFYAMVTDAQPPVVRATVLVLVFCCAQLLGRRGMAFNTLAAAALVVLVLNPVELFRAGTQLSFLAVGALIAIGQSWLAQPTSATDSLVTQSLPARTQLTYLLLRLIGQATLVSFVVWIVVQPLVAARFNLITPSAIILGPLLAIPVAIAMTAGFAVMVFGWLLPPLGAVCGFVCDRALAVVVATVEAARDAPGGKFWTPGPSDWWLAGFYTMLVAWAVVPQVRQIRRRWIVMASAAWLAIGLAVASFPTPTKDSLHAAFLSVGHGLSVVIELPGGKTVVYDAGSMAAPELAARSVSSYLFSRGISQIDLLVISHADADHYNAIPQLLTQFRVREVCYTAQMFRDEVEPLIVLREALAAAVLRIREVRSGDVLLDDDVSQLKVIHPSSGGVPGSDNANSIVLQVTFQGQTILLTGDLESPGIELVMNTTTAPIDVLLAPHHGSARSDPPGFARWAAAKRVVISGSSRDRSPEVRAVYKAEGGAVYHTATCGAVEVDLSANGCTIDTIRKP
jgi:competence protein ComEC